MNLKYAPINPANLAAPLVAEVSARYPRLQVVSTMDKSLMLHADPRRLAVAVRWMLLLACEAAQQQVTLRVEVSESRSTNEVLVEHDGMAHPALTEGSSGPGQLSSLLRMGWWLTEKIALAHGGRLSLSRCSGQGWRFAIVVPAVPLPV